MLVIDPAWAGKVQFYELLFGTWTAYIFLVLLWEKVLRAPLAEWRYVLMNFMGAGAFWINHYFQKAPFWLTMLNLYTVGRREGPAPPGGLESWRHALRAGLHGGLHLLRAALPLRGRALRRERILVHGRQLLRLHRRHPLARPAAYLT